MCTRYLQPFFQPLFDSDEDNRMLFKWINIIVFNDGYPTVTKNRPDSWVENDCETIGFIEVKTIESAANHRRINADLYRLGIFGKTALYQYGLNKTFQVMVIGKCCIVDRYMFYLAIRC